MKKGEEVKKICVKKSGDGIKPPWGEGKGRCKPVHEKNTEKGRITFIWFWVGWE